ncbi:MAG: hypothetical protein WDA60_18725 [Acidimicrobiia bacterium]
MLRGCWVRNLLWRSVYVTCLAVGFIVITVICFLGSDSPFDDRRLLPNRRRIPGAYRVSLLTMPSRCASRITPASTGMRLRGLVPGWLTLTDGELRWEPLPTVYPSGTDWLAPSGAPLRAWKAPTGSWLVAAEVDRNGTREPIAFLVRRWHDESCAFAAAVAGAELDVSRDV